jgi:pimeloyl-ACP methyl ester carboxylesterase
MTFAYFGDPDRQLFGSLTRTQRLARRSAAVLLCNPFGEEAVRAHRSYRVLAAQLARQGYDVLRFDFSHTGDSMGDAENGSVEKWLGDVASAHAWLRETTDGRQVVAVGLRFGATLAALTTSRHELKLRHLVLWDPVVKGADYLAGLRAAHEDYMRAELSPASLRRRTPPPSEAPTEVLGTPISVKLAAEMASIDLTTEDVRAEQITILDTASDPMLDRLRMTPLGQDARARWLTVASRTPWNTEVALNAQLVPMDILERIIDRIQTVSP